MEMVLLPKDDLEKLLHKVVAEELSKENQQEPQLPRVASKAYILGHPEIFGIKTNGTLQDRRDKIRADPAVDETTIYWKVGKSYMYDPTALQEWIKSSARKKEADRKIDPRLKQKGYLS